MEYTLFKSIFNKQIFENSKVDLLTKIVLNPSRYVGIFRPTKPRAKIIQNLSQSHEIRFGDAFEKLLELYFQENNYTLLPKKVKDLNNEDLSIDQLFFKDNDLFFIEQKIRDDHDSTKKVGQINNFDRKIQVLKNYYPNDNLKGFFYFIDPDLIKNQNYYVKQLMVLSNKYLNVDLKVSYGKDLFIHLDKVFIWEEIENHLKKWREELPEFPEINFDLDSNETFNEIKTIPPNVFKELFENDLVYNEIVLCIFPTKETLYLLLDFFKKEKSYKNVALILENRLKN
ncbi:MAG: restriction endonuclease [Bacteroidetes bacterium]|nr:MAG: restriction endonuclease [Bacteroidota bacterium]TAG88800.1 MAG: restriction endonuclease [Bacteroidota bacterium]